MTGEAGDRLEEIVERYEKALRTIAESKTLWPSVVAMKALVEDRESERRARIEAQRRAQGYA